MEDKPNIVELQSMSLEMKVAHSLNVISSAINDRPMYISYSGGKDSVVMRDLVMRIDSSVPSVFIDTGLEFPEIRDFVKNTDNVEWIRPEMTFKEVIKKYGFPAISKEQSQFIYEARTTKSEKLLDIRMNGNKWGRGKVSNKWKHVVDAPFQLSHKCCNILKKKPANKYEKATGRTPFIGTMASESALRAIQWSKDGCNAFNKKRPTSNPIMIWTEKDIWEYIHKFKIPYSSIYDMGYKRTGCCFCMYGAHKDEYPNRFQRMAETHPALHNYCINKLELGEVLDFLNVEY